ncbi:hypothetical protein LCGC14_1070500 [marine sediment metagenome]|uniref:Uncharacterized protein n=1 Tax=marine sediment metagenome TaxID=412755 RepID=A0A0F9QP85_9ZZZZ
MKATKKEVVEAIEAIYNGAAPDYEIHLGVESDGDMVVVFKMDKFDSEFSIVAGREVLKLARKYDEEYISLPLGHYLYRQYMQSGFVEAEEVEDQPVPWYEEEWEARQPDSSVIRVNILSRRQEGVVLLATAWEFPMAERIMGMQKLVKAVREHVANFADESPGHPAMIEALKEMGAEE